MITLSTEDMMTLPGPQTVEPFGKINYWDLPDGSRRIRAYVLVERAIEGAKAGVAIDGSVSMRSAFGARGLLGFLSPSPAANVVSPAAQEMCAYLARKLSVDGRVSVIYWATGRGGGHIEEIADLTADEAERHTFVGPQRYGGGTKLLPALEYFVDQRFPDAAWGMYLFITDGALHDLEEVKQYTIQLARDIASGRRNDLKLVMIGVGDLVDEGQMEELDDLDTGTDLDLWDHKLAAEMRQLAEIFSEVVDEYTMVADSGVILDDRGTMVMDYRDQGVPALMVFTVPAGAKAFCLEIGGQSVTQPLP